MTRRAGFTLGELLLAVTIIGTLSAIAVPKFADVRRRAQASTILVDIETVRSATYGFYSDSGYFPSEVGGGNIPTNLSNYLPKNFSFKKKDWQIDYENWTLKYTPVYSKSKTVIGVTITPTDPKVGTAAFTMYGDSPKFIVGQKVTFIVVGM